MPPIRTSRNRKPPPAGFDDIEDTLLELFLLSFMRCVFRILHFVAEFQQGIFNIVEAGGRREHPAETKSGRTRLL
jgi:hypothetical protein